MPQGLLAGRTIGARYELLDLVGVGGMGEVYRARDRELDEILAIKVIREELVALPGVIEQFRSEVKLARRVTHRNVARTYELGRADGVTYYTMELVEGMPLTRRIAARGGRPFAVAEVAELGVALCDALTAAHAAGVIHRDLKPDNILLAGEGRIVLADFGIAAAVRAGGGASGTPRYMAPEQARGEPPTPATDVYALGVVLYELLAGAPAFTGSVLAIIDAKQTLEHLTLEGGDPRIAELIARATARDPEARPRSAAALRRELAPYVRTHAIEAASEPSAVTSVALPTVVVHAPVAATDAPSHLVDGFHQALLTRLAEWPRVRVSPRPVVGAAVVDVTLVASATELEVRAAVGSSLLVLREPCAAESLVGGAERSARVLVALTGSPAAPPPVRTRPIPADALELVLRARHLARRNRSQVAEATVLCRDALARAPGHPFVLAILAQSEVQQTFYDRTAAPALLDSAADHALAALAADPDLADGHFARGHVELHRGRPVIAAASFRTAIARAPLFAEAHEWLGRQLLEAGFIVDARARMDEALALSPYFGMIHSELALALLLDGKLDQAERSLARMGPLGPAGGFGFWLRWHSWLGDRDAEQIAFEALAASSGGVFTGRFVRIAYDLAMPWSERAPLLLAEERALAGPSARWRAFLAQLVAEIASRAGDAETAIAAIRRSLADGLFDRPWIERCPLLTAVREHPAFPALAAEVSARAHAIHDALYGDLRQLATAPTSLTLT